MTPAQEQCRNAQAQLWRGGTEPALFLCLLHQSNRDGGEKREEGGGGREGARREGGEKRHKSERARGRKGRGKTESGTVETFAQKRHPLLLNTKVGNQTPCFVSTSGHLQISQTVITVVQISSHRFKTATRDLSAHTASAAGECVRYRAGQHGGSSGPGVLAPQIKGCLAID